MTAPVSLSPSEIMDSPLLFGPHFAGDSWNLWRAIIRAAFAEPLTDAQLDLFRTVAGRLPPKKRVHELAVIAGRGAGKNSISALLAVAIALNFDPVNLRPGERATIFCLAVDKNQAQIAFAYIKALIESVPAVARLIINTGSGIIELRNRVVIEVAVASFRSIRGRSILACIFDECCFWRDENYASPDIEVFNAVSPGLARMRKSGSLLIMISSAHKRSGLLYNRWKDYYGRDDDGILVCRGTTLQFNSGLDERIIDRALEEDLPRFSAEYLSEFRDDLSSYISRELLEAAVDRGAIVRPPQKGVVYVAACDASGGRADSFTAAVAHRDKDGAVILDAVVEHKPPFSPAEVVNAIAALISPYHLHSIVGDNYSAEWVADAFRRAGVTYKKSERDRSAAYRDALPLFSSGNVRLLDNPRLVNQFASLERRLFPTGRERIDHPISGSDDLANAAALALTLAAAKKGFDSAAMSRAIEHVSATAAAGNTIRRHVPFRFGGGQGRGTAWGGMFRGPQY